VLSDAFLDFHCFSLRRSGKRLGLDFVPVREEPGDVRGTLWLDRDGRELRQIEFEYAPSTHPVLVRGATGTMDFARTPEGFSYVQRWRIRVPMYTQPGDKRTVTAGGEVVKTWVVDR
jgi:hypothetical protein